MTKAKSRAQRRAARRARREADTGLPDIEPIKRREGNGRKSRAGVSRDASVPVLIGRCLRRGVDPTPDEIRESRAPWWGCEAGRAMARHSAAGDRESLWGAIQHMRRVTAAYDAACGAPRRHAVCLRLLTPPDRLEVTAETPPLDDRPDAERSRAAVSAWMAMHSWLGRADKVDAGEALRVVIDDTPARNPAGLVQALRCVADGVAGRRVIYRGR